MPRSLALCVRSLLWVVATFPQSRSNQAHGCLFFLLLCTKFLEAMVQLGSELQLTGKETRNLPDESFLFSRQGGPAG